MPALSSPSALPDLSLPFFDEAQRELAAAATDWAQTHLTQPTDTLDSAALDAHCRALARQLGEAGWLQYCMPPQAGKQSENHAASHGPATLATLASLDIRAICLLREIFAWHSTLADFVFAMQGLGAGAISLFGDAQQQARYLPGVVSGKQLAAFALSEPEAGSDVAALSCQAQPLPEGGWRLNGEKIWISNGGIADFYVVFARTAAPSPSRRSDGISAFIVDANQPGLHVLERIQTLSPHPLAHLKFTDCQVTENQLIGQPGEGFRIAMATLDLFRISVAAAALGMARRANHETLHHLQQRQLFSRPLADFQLSQASLADMTTATEAATLLTYRAAWQRDQQPARRSSHNAHDTRNTHNTRSAAMAKLFATEAAQQSIDRAVQLFGGRGIKQGEVVELLYRNIRALRIYEGASEVQKLIIARETLQAFKDKHNLP